MILTLFWAETGRESRAALRRDKESRRLSALRFIPLHTSLSSEKLQLGPN